MQSNLLTIYCLFIVVFVTTNVVNGQMCTASTLISNFSSVQAPSVQCQVGYAPDTNQCRPYDTVFDENYGKPCNATSECLLSFVCSEVSKICVPSATRKQGESCLAKESCIGTLGCVNGICTPYTASYEKKLGEKCGFIDYSTNKLYYCADPYYCDFVTYPNYRCYQRVYNGAGGSCGYNETTYQVGSCSSGTTCNYNIKKCVPYVYNGPGESCNVLTQDSYSMCKSPYYCSGGLCYSNIVAGLGEACSYKNSTSYTITYCPSNLICGPTSKCVNSVSSPIGGYCGLNGTDMYTCSYSSATCYMEKCIPNIKSNVGGLCDIVNVNGSYSCNNPLYCFSNTCMEKGNLSQSCEHKTDSCGFDLVCRSVLGGSSPRTCEYPGKKYDNCTLSSDCSYGLSCVKSKCSNLNGNPVGMKCTMNYDCDSGLCLNNFCSLNYNETTCTNDASCSSYDSKCSCGSGKQSSSTPGTCASMRRCKALRTILNVCLNNNARNSLLTTIFDKYSSIHKACVKEFSQYYSCLRIGFTNAGMIPALSISGLDVNTDFDIDPAPAKVYKCNYYYSTESYVCSGKGDCVADGVCKCYTGYYGTNCQSTIAPQKSNPIIPARSIGNNNGGINRNNTDVSGAGALKENSLILTLNIIILILGFIFH